MKNVYMRNLSMFYMKLQAKHLIPSSTVQLIVEEINKLSGLCQQYTKNQLKASRQAKTKLSETEIEDVVKTLDDLDIHGSCSSANSTDYNENRTLRKIFPTCIQNAFFWGLMKTERSGMCSIFP